MSQFPLKFNTLPLTLSLDLLFKSPLKLNLKRNDHKLLNDPTELLLPEYHSLRFEGLLKPTDLTYHASDIVKVRNIYRALAEKISKGLMPEDVVEWTITNLDNRIEYRDYHF